MITYLEFKNPLPVISIGFLMIVSSSQSILDQSHFFHSLMYDVRDKDGRLSYLKPPNWGPASRIIQFFKMCHSNTGMIAIIITELNQWQVIIPTPLEKK